MGTAIAPRTTQQGNGCQPAKLDLDVLVVSTLPHYSLRLAMCLGAAGVRVHLLTDRAWEPARFSRFCKGFLSLPRDEIERGSDAFVDRVNEYCAREGIAFVIPADMRPTRSVNACRDRLPGVRTYPAPDIALINELHNKWSFYRRIESLGLPTPRTRLVERIADVSALDLSFPVIVKPLDSEYGNGVRKIGSAAELVSHLERATNGPAPPIIAQEYIEGVDVDLSLLADRGDVVAWTVQERVGGGEGRMQFFNNREILEIGRTIVAGCGYHGIAHIDLRRDAVSGKVYAIELNPRFWGSLLYSVWMGVNFPLLGLRMALGDDPRPEFRPVEGLCEDPGISPRRLLKSLLRGRLVPPDLTPGGRAAWRFNLSDPLPWLLFRIRKLHTARRQRKTSGG